ncbi:MAG: sulfatase-like hydrolase/transferase [Planctomycetota bacterium]|nr:sulfatase-like hydrolase/transferase [Planctomycetota bacterium]
MARPNILIFMADHQRGDTVLPDHPVVAPHVRRLAREGVTFTQTFCPSPHCSPARATFHSGLYPTRAGVWNNVCNNQALTRGLADGVRLWSQDLAEAGYRLAWSGKWHVSVKESPRDRGWTELFVSGAKPAEHQIGWDKYREMAQRPEPAARGEGEILRPGYGAYRLYGTAADAGQAYDERTVAAAVKALPDLAAKGEPWAMFVGIASPHDPYVAPKRCLDLYDLKDVPLPANFDDDFKDKPRVYQRMRRQAWGQLTEREIREGIRHFWAYCSYVDELFGKVLAALDATGQADNTLVLFTSDHGDYGGEHGLFAKGIPCFRGAYHVPAVVRWPGGVRKAGRQVGEFVSLADFGPTFLEAAGIKAPREFSGASLVPFLRDEPPAGWRDDIHTQCNGVELYYTQRSVMTREHKYVFNGFDEDELYDLRQDPHEKRNVAADPAYEKIKQDLVRRMWRFACREQDTAINSYITVSLAPFGPAEAFRSSGTACRAPTENSDADTPPCA